MPHGAGLETGGRLVLCHRECRANPGIRDLDAAAGLKRGKITKNEDVS